MKPADRYKFILKYMESKSIGRLRHTVDCLDSDFVDAYIEETGASFQCMMIGAHKCNQLSRDLADMVKLGMLKRWRSGLQGALSGFPKWVWCYYIPDETGK